MYAKKFEEMMQQLNFTLKLVRQIIGGNNMSGKNNARKGALKDDGNADQNSIDDIYNDETFSRSSGEGSEANTYSYYKWE